MSENTSAVETNEAVELTYEVLVEIVADLVGTSNEQTAFAVAKAVNNTFKAVEFDKTIPTQMTYNYTRNGLIAKGKKGSAKEIRYTADEVNAFVLKYTRKHLNV